MRHAFLLAGVVLMMAGFSLRGAAAAETRPEPNYDESAVGTFTLPNVLAGPDGIDEECRPMALRDPAGVAMASLRVVDGLEVSAVA